ncbi:MULTISPECIES: cell division protein SepF [Pelosinus]|jgi:cell division inhibitor SepF|uniref:Cell division protein SepF n=3 Tax=Pelosinus TaxID=365348 RepID=I8U1J5_9FIRM|nr:MULTISPECIES: cell division protein SepF [Pelosinus]MBP2660770.1 Cell division protein sepF [Bacillota bacterium]AJQ27402.1 Cell division protein sepF [Pelosinus fermentans JBW45]EIW24163.1 Cell division protein sepF [Pelosinus fermentans A11]MCC5465033.1 cell division protein SepF [Pelosinus baikalensis]OAM94142.1 Cell division protein sepF [Pelosinus fermentans DSM 17108]
MKFMEKVWGSLGLFEPVEAEEDPKQKVEELEVGKGKKNSNLVNLPTAQKQMKVMVVEPFSFDDAQHVADHLKNRKPVVVNFENCDKEVAKRMIDFISGTTYALAGSIQKIGNNIFLCAPNNVDVTYSPHEEGSDKEFLPWNK